MKICYIVNLINLAHIVKHEDISLLADTIQNESNLQFVDVIPHFDAYDEKINASLIEDIIRIKESLNYSCEINKKQSSSVVNIEKVYNQENDKMTKIL